MNDWFKWNGVSCTNYGIHVSEHPPITMPSERAVFTSVPGKSGNLTTVEGDAVYDDLILTVQCFIADPSYIPQIAGWLRGPGKVTFANRPNGYYEARVVNQIPFDVIVRGNPYRSFNVNFRCKPFFRLNDSEDITISRSGDFIRNPGCIPSAPILTITGVGDITLMIGMQIIELTDVDGEITVNSEIEEVYSGTALCNEKMEGDFPLLQPGISAVSWDGDVTSVVIKPNWRTL